MSDKANIKFYYKDPEYGEEFKLSEKIEPSMEDEVEIDYLLNEFKKFLKVIGYSEISVDHIKYLEDEEWKYVCEQYHEWNSEKQKLYDIWTKNVQLIK